MPGNLCGFLENLILRIGDNGLVEAIYDRYKLFFGDSVLHELTAIASQERVAFAVGDLGES